MQDNCNLTLKGLIISIGLRYFYKVSNHNIKTRIIIYYIFLSEKI